VIWQCEFGSRLASNCYAALYLLQGAQSDRPCSDGYVSPLNLNHDQQHCSTSGPRWFSLRQRCVAVLNSQPAFIALSSQPSVHAALVCEVGCDVETIDSDVTLHGQISALCRTHARTHAVSYYSSHSLAPCLPVCLPAVRSLLSVLS